MYPFITENSTDLVVTQSGNTLVVTQPGNALAIAQPANLLSVGQNENVIQITAPGPQGAPGAAGAGAGAINNYVQVTSDYYVTLGYDGWIDVLCDSGDVNIWLPLSASGNAKQYVQVAKNDSSPYTVHVKTIMGQTIDGTITDFQIYEPYSSFGFLSRGSSYKSF